MDYAIPRAADVPTFVVAFNRVPCLTNPLGVKGTGEGGCVAAPRVVVNAVLDALRPLGVNHIDMPITPERTWREIQNSRTVNWLVSDVAYALGSLSLFLAIAITATVVSLPRL